MTRFGSAAALLCQESLSSVSDLSWERDLLGRRFFEGNTFP